MISDEKLIEIYAAMVKCRMLARRASLLKRQGKLASDLETGVDREAAVAGLVVDLLPGDTLSFARHYSVSGFLKGPPLKDAFATLVKTADGHGPARLTRKVENNGAVQVIPSTANHAAQLYIACGVALACKDAKNRGIAVAFCEDGTESLEGWPDTLAFAGRHSLPILFVHQSAPAHARDDGLEQVRGEEGGLHTQTRGVPTIIVDANDAVAVYRVASESIARARLGRGPTLIECGVYDLRGPADNHRKKGRRPERNDPIPAMEIYLTRKGIFNEKLRRQMAAGIRRELDAATRFLNN